MVIDIFLKRGNLFRSQVNQHDLMALIQFVKDRDTFLKAYRARLFLRLVMRSTVGIDREKGFIQEIGSLFQNTETLTRLVEEAEPRVEQGVSGFSYVLVNAVQFPVKNWDYALADVPRAYASARAKVTTALRTRLPQRVYEWLDGVATCIVMVKTPGGVSELTLSLRGLALMEQLATHAKVTLGAMMGAAKMSRKFIDPILEAFVEGGLVCKEDSPDGASYKINPEFAGKRIVLAENWETPVADREHLRQEGVRLAHACIVKIMKGARKMGRPQLMEAAAKQLAKKCSVSMAGLRQALQMALAEQYLREIDDEHLEFVP
jgi:hypothetical protein